MPAKVSMPVSQSRERLCIVRKSTPKKSQKTFMAPNPQTLKHIAEEVGQWVGVPKAAKGAFCTS